MRKLLLIGLILLAGCQRIVTTGDIEVAQELCKGQGGLKHLMKKEYWLEATCENGMVFQKYIGRQR